MITMAMKITITMAMKITIKLSTKITITIVNANNYNNDKMVKFLLPLTKAIMMIIMKTQLTMTL